MPKTIEVSHRTIVFTAVFIFLLWFLFQIRETILMLFVSLILMSALNPFVDHLEKLKLPRWLAITVVYLIFWIFIGLMLAGIIPGLVDQTTRLIHLLPLALERLQLAGFDQQDLYRQFIAQISALPGDFVKLTVSFFNNILGVITTLVITFYLLFERKNLNKYLSFLMGTDKPGKATKVINQIETRLGGWVRGELILMFIIGILTYIGLLILGIDIALPLAVLAGLLEIIPNIGPIISAIPATLVALTIHPLVAVATVILYLLVHFLENNLITPHVMRQAVGINPLVSIIVLMIGFKLAGPVGAVLAIPIFIIVQIIVSEAELFRV